MSQKSLAELVKSEPIQQIAGSEVDRCRFLRFPIGEETTGLVSLDRLVEVIKVRPNEILPIPELPEYLLGIANRRGEAVWIVDLFYLMGSTPLSRREVVPEVCMAILVQAQEQAIGLLVERVSSIEVHNLNYLQPFSVKTLPSKLLSFFEGYFVDSEGNILALLNVDTIIEKVENLDEDIE